MINKIRVYGKAQNRTSLGIMHAYMKMFPDATLKDLRKAFPNRLAPDNGTGEIFVYKNQKGTTANWDGYFREDDEILIDGNGKKIAVNKLWTKSSFDNLVKHASRYAIEIAQFEEGVRGVKGGFRLEYINGYTPDKCSKPSKKWLLWLLILIVICSVAAYFLV